jgi:uncharacterized membrane protein YfcA
MKELLQILKDTGFDIGKGLLRVASSFIFGIFFVYLLGRALNIIKSDRAKNLTALIVITGSSIYTSILYFDNNKIIYETMIVIALSYIVYVLLGFKLYDRIDSFLDKKIGEDKEVKNGRSKKK